MNKQPRTSKPKRPRLLGAAYLLAITSFLMCFVGGKNDAAEIRPTVNRLVDGQGFPFVHQLMLANLVHDFEQGVVIGCVLVRRQIASLPKKIGKVSGVLVVKANSKIRPNGVEQRLIQDQLLN